MARKTVQTPELIDPDAPLSVSTSAGDTYLALTPEADLVPVHREVKRRTIRDLGISGAKANPIMVVIAYEMYGFDDRSISEVTGLSVGQLNDIRSVAQYKEIKAVLLETISNSSRDSVISELERHSMRAVEVYVEALNAPRHSISMAAADRVLGTLGYSQSGNASKKQSASEGLTIVINTNRDDHTTIEGFPNASN